MFLFGSHFGFLTPAGFSDCPFPTCRFSACRFSASKG